MMDNCDEDYLAQTAGQIKHYHAEDDLDKQLVAEHYSHSEQDFTD